MSTSASHAGRRFIGSPAEGIALVLFTACSWGLTWPQFKYPLSLLPPFTMRATPGVLGCLFAFAVAATREERLRPPRDQWVMLFVFAQLNYGLFIILTTQALVWLKASEAVTITYMLPIWASVLAHFSLVKHGSAVPLRAKRPFHRLIGRFTDILRPRPRPAKTVRPMRVRDARLLVVPVFCWVSLCSTVVSVCGCCIVTLLADAA